MQKIKKKCTAILLLMAVLASVLLPAATADTYEAATSYTNAKEFYNSTALEGEYYHAEMMNGTIYYATCAKLAVSSSNLKYYTLGFDITLSGNGYSVSFAVQRTGGSMTEVNGVDSDGYLYTLYAVETATLYSLAQAADADSAAYVLSAGNIHVKMDAIMTTKSETGINGSITEDGFGGLEEDGTIYHLKDSDDLTAIKSVFTGHEFKSYYNINEDLDNYQLAIRYALDGTASHANGSSTRAAVGNGYSLADLTGNDAAAFGVLHQNGSPYTTTARVLQQVYLLTPDSISLRKEGYHMDTGREWVTSDGRVLDASSVYMSKDIDADVGYQNRNIFLYANWQPNTYTIHYDNNGGMGFTADTKHSFDQAKALRSNSFMKPGHTLVPGAEWNTKPDGTGISYGSGELVENLVSEDGGTITLYANWQEGVYQIDTDKDGGSGGTDGFYEKYGTGWYSDAGLSRAIQGITPPAKSGYAFQGYYQYFFGMGQPVTDISGKIMVAPDFYTRNSTIYADYEAKNFTITFDKQGGSGGTDSVAVTYDEVLPPASAPVRNGYTFKGYFDRKNGKGTRYYNEYMASGKLYQTDGNLTLYAYWADGTPPITSLSAIETWSRNAGGIEVTGTAVDAGEGLDRMELYCGSTLVSSRTGLNGSETASVPYYHKTEGVYQYKIVAYDLAGNVSESYATVKYDTTAPTGSFTVNGGSVTNFSISVSATDYKIQ